MDIMLLDMEHDVNQMTPHAGATGYGTFDNWRAGFNLGMQQFKIGLSALTFHLRNFLREKEVI